MTSSKTDKKDFLNFQINKTDTRWALLLDAGAPIAFIWAAHINTKHDNKHNDMPSEHVAAVPSFV